jgi:hypothetical protein
MTPEQHEVAQERLSKALGGPGGLWEIYRKVRELSEIAVLLALSHYVLSLRPESQIKIALDQSDQDFSSMTFACLFVFGESLDAEEAGLDENSLWDFASSLDSSQVSQWGFVTAPSPETGPYYEFDPREAIEWLTPHAAALDPMPNPGDLAAIGKWLDDMESDETKENG